MQIAIVKYNAGNIYSVVNALRRMGIEPLLTDDAELLKKADRVLFPGQGHAGEAMDYLRSRGLDQMIRDLKQPVFGICVGQQLLCKHSEEGDTDCIGIFKPYVYFVHSYYVPICEETIATADYILPYSASMHKDNFYACQFHPEKSGKVGEQILKNFLEL